MQSWLYIWIPAFLISFSIHAQKSFLHEGTVLFNAGKYKEAISVFNRDEGAKNNKELLMMRVEANIHIHKLQAAKNDIPALLSFKSPPPKVDLFIAKIYHAEHDFLKAAEYYKRYYRNINKVEEEKKDIIQRIKHCHSGSKLIFISSPGKVENPGEPFNTVADDYRPIQSPNVPNRFYFSSNRAISTGSALNKEGIADSIFGLKQTDIFNSELIGGEWQVPLGISAQINSEYSDELMSLSQNGRKLVYLRYSYAEGKQLYINTYQDSANVDLQDELFYTTVDVNSGDRDLFICNDSLLMFSSKRPGGFGGYDLYLTSYQYNGWTSPQNLGPEINGIYDEISPFVSADGSELYFSSNRVQSMGGYDIFKSEKNFTDNRWKFPENMGFGVNSSQDDFGFMVSIDGYFGSFNSNRKSGLGGQDIYYFKWNERNKHMLGPLAGFSHMYTPDYLEAFPVVILDRNKLKDSKNQQFNKNYIDEKTYTDLFESYKQKEIELNTDKFSDTILFFVNDIYDDIESGLLSVSNTKYLEKIVKLMLKDTDIALEISSHYFDEALIDHNLFISMKRAETVKAFLVQEGVKSEQIRLKGYGSNYPQRGRNRIEFKFKKGFNPNIQFIEMQTDHSALPIDRGGLWYKMQIAQTEEMYSHEILSLYSHSIVEWDQENKMYLYSLGIYEDYALAKAAFDELKDGGIEKVKIIPYLNGVRIQDFEIMELYNTYPDLKKYQEAFKQ